MEYKVPSVAEIEEELLKNISDDYVKNPGTFTRDLIKTFAIESHTLEEKLINIYKKLDIYNLSSGELERFVEQRKGVKRKGANPSKGVLTVEGNGEIKVGDIFETENGTRYKVVENVTISGKEKVKIEAVIPGSDGNVGTNSITMMPITIQGITKVYNEEQLIDGYAAETDESLRERYLIEIQKPATSGNIYHYIHWGREVTGVGDVRVFPLWNGNNTVQMIIIDDNKENANAELVKRVQDYVDPKGEDDETWGAGAGQAPIGAYCTVASATPKSININMRLILKIGYDIEKLKPLIKEEIKKYLKSIAFKRDAVSYALLSSWILNVEGVQEWTTFTLNGILSNVAIGEKEVAIMGEVQINVA